MADTDTPTPEQSVAYAMAPTADGGTLLALGLTRQAWLFLKSGKHQMADLNGLKVVFFAGETRADLDKVLENMVTLPPPQPPDPVALEAARLRTERHAEAEYTTMREAIAHTLNGAPDDMVDAVTKAALAALPRS